MRSILFVLPLVSSALAVANCQDNYCCDGSVVMKKHNNDFSASNYWCCQGDPNQGVFGDTGPTTCTAGTQIPLTQASAAGGSKTSSAVAAGSSAASGGSSSSSSRGAAAALITAAPLVGAAVAVGQVLLVF